MKELDKETKIKVIKYAIEYYTSILSQEPCGYYRVGICNVVSKYIHNHIGIKELFKLIPELRKYEPLRYDSLWFPTDDNGIERRIKILEEIKDNIKISKPGKTQKRFRERLGTSI